jgi:predicted AlkP superfamily phosphohydrolase/phosphomutase
MSPFTARSRPSNANDRLCYARASHVRRGGPRVNRVLVVGWDGATWAIANRLSGQGRLPTLKRLRDQGAHGVLESVPNMNSAPAWSTIATGLNPGRHGIFYFDEPVPGTYRRTIVNAERRSGASLWRLVSEAGGRVIVVNVPISYPAEHVNGSMVAGLDTPSKSLPGFTWPRDLPSRYPDLFRHYVVEPGAPSLMRAGRVQEAREKLYASVEGWVSMTERLMRDEEWDLAFVVFTSTDTAQHFFWAEEGREVVERVYEIQDEATGRLVDLARSQDPDATVLVLADHGGAVNSRGAELLPIWLEDQGLMARGRASIGSRALAAGFRVFDRTLTREQKQALARRFGRLRERAQSDARLDGILWERTSAYADGRRDEVAINLIGREPRGAVPAGDYERFVAELRDRLVDLTEADTGRRAVSSVTPRWEAYHGRFVHRAPDLTIQWKLDGGPLRGLVCESPRGRARMREVVGRPPFQTGGHHPEGLFVANGPTVRHGTTGGSLMDVTPTLLALLGVGIPEGLDGHPLELVAHAPDAAITPPPERRQPAPSRATGLEDLGSGSSGYTADQEEAVRRRLEDLGYI